MRSKAYTRDATKYMLCSSILRGFETIIPYMGKQTWQKTQESNYTFLGLLHVLLTLINIAHIYIYKFNVIETNFGS